MKNEYPSLVGFRARKAAQVAAFFTISAGGKIDKLKLIKLIYLAERESAAQRDHLMLNDQYYSLEHGPICSATLNGINGRADTGAWRKYINLTDKTVTVRRSTARDDLDQISNSDLEILKKVWSEFGHMKPMEIRQWTHDHCPEYQDVPAGKSLPIPCEDIFEALGKPNAIAMAEEIQARRRLERFFVSQ
jgi:uncharacterized phage-associated protein